MRYGDVSAIGPVAAGSLLWRAYGRLHVTIVAKATFAFRLEGPMSVCRPQPLVIADVPHAGGSTPGVRIPTDAVPYRERADVLLVGHAHAPRDRPAASARVRLALAGQSALLDKTLAVDGAGGSLPATVGALAPLSAQWLAPVAGRPADHRGPPVIEIPAGFDWSCLQVAPLDQRIAYLRADEWLLLEGVDPERWRVCTRLPGAAAVGWVWSAGGPHEAGYAVPMNADTLFIDADAGTCTLAWRGCFAIEQEQVLDALHIVAAMQCSDRPVDWPVELARVAWSAPRRASSAAVLVDPTGMVCLAPSVPPAPAPASTADDARWTATGKSSASPADELAETFVWARPCEDEEHTAADRRKTVLREPRSEHQEQDADRRKTVLREPATEQRAGAAAADEVWRAPSASADGPASLEVTTSVAGTLHMDIDAPFAVLPAGQVRIVLHPASVPGAPWSKERARPVPVPSSDPREETLGIAQPASSVAAEQARDAGARLLALLAAASPQQVDPPEADDDRWRARPETVQPWAPGRGENGRPQPEPLEPGTIALGQAAPASMHAPYELAAAAEPRAGVAAPFPDAPWSAARGQPVQPPSDDPREGTLGLAGSAPASPEIIADGLGASFLSAMAAAGTRPRGARAAVDPVTQRGQPPKRGTRE